MDVSTVSPTAVSIPSAIVGQNSHRSRYLTAVGSDRASPVKKPKPKNKDRNGGLNKTINTDRFSGDGKVTKGWAMCKGKIILLESVSRTRHEILNSIRWECLKIHGYRIVRVRVEVV